MSTNPSRILVCIATAALFAAAGPPVQAGNWGGLFDPTGGATAVTGFNGTDLINIGGSDCLPGGSFPGPINFFYVNGFGDNNCTAALLNASITLHSNVEGDTAQLTFASDSAIWGLDIGPGGVLLGVDSFQIGPAFPPEGSDPIFAGPWYITLSAQDGHTPPCVNCLFVDPPPSNVVILTDGVSFTSDPYVFFPVRDTAPEPGSLGLLLGALGAGWLTRRRKAAA